MARDRDSTGTFLKVFLAIWVLFLVVFDAVIAWQLVQQVVAGATFVPVPAIVVSSHVEVDSSGDGTSYHARISYRYAAAGVEHTSDRISFAEWGTSDRDAVDRIVEAYPEGEEVTAFHDPDDPSRAVLRADFGGFPFVVFLFLTPFHCVAFGIWAGLRLGRARAGETGIVLATLESDDGAVAVLRPPALPSSLVFAIVLGAGGFVATFAVAFGAGIDASAITVAGTFALLVGLATAAVAVHARRAGAPSRRVTIDSRRRAVLVGASRADGLPGREIPFEDIDGVEVVSSHFGQVNGRTWYRHDVMLDLRDAPAERAVFLRGPDGRAEPLAHWLRGRLGQAAPLTASGTA